MGQLHVNVIHRLNMRDLNHEIFEALEYQQNAAHKAGIKTTLLLGVSSLYSEECIEYALQQNREFGDELGLALHGVAREGLGERFGIKDEMVYLMPHDRKIKLLSYVMELFKEKIGYYPKSIASYVLDARTLNWFHENYPSIKAAITNCFEEGTKMFYGNQNQWYLFSDGGPWGAYYPSKKNSLAEAKSEEEYCGIVGLPHLNRDMLMAITSRDDLFSSHAHNVMRAKAYDLDAMEMPYMERFVDQWVEQLKYNEYIYYNVFVSSHWLTNGSMLDEPEEFSKRLYKESMDYLGQKIKEQVAVASTMSEFAEWMETNVSIGTPEVNKWRDIICGSDREMYWYVDPDFRITLDANVAGAIVDLRPHAGRLERNLGNDTKYLQNMNYPFLISSEYRGGVHDGSIHTYRVTVNGETTDLSLKRTSVTAGTDKMGRKTALFAPVTYTLNGIKITMDSQYTFCGDGSIQIERRVLECSDENADIEVTEYHCGCWGTNTYPEDMRNIKMSMLDNEGKAHIIEYKYLGRELECVDSHKLVTTIPELNISVEMRALTKGVKAKITEGWMFRPFYYMTLSKALKKGEVLRTCIKILQAE